MRVALTSKITSSYSTVPGKRVKATRIPVGGGEVDIGRGNAFGGRDEDEDEVILEVKATRIPVGGGEVDIGRGNAFGG
eukprot:CAMPEP_0204904796 /NCGR_PEP_ID=MMETSP1397-20131031/5060_1 /ASSEMBLY_ACC=CAM_ASM_000891 /TAXON_ID=49980 /ORGANISM="Climacostomum Climacostomum virens, Strain Stock W-24" /LENGTH=77 /DNA_ID=CAMNT_0052073615 /DNA_START=1 /DNA_END=232 /DNA_ORIENTATION=-